MDRDGACRQAVPGAASPSVDSEEREALRREILARAVLLGDAITYDFRELLTHPRSARRAGRLMWRLVRPFAPDVLVGPGFGAAPLLAATAAAALEDGVEVPYLMVRDRRKDHGRKRWVEGTRCAPGTRAVIVDDFLGRGSGLALVDEALRHDRIPLSICALAVLFDDWKPLGSRQLSVSRFPVVSVFRRHDLGLTRDCHDARPPRMSGAAPPFPRDLHWWRFELNVHPERPLKCSPAIADDAVFVGDDRARIWRIDAATGEAVWRRGSLGDPYKGIVQRLLHADGSVVYGCYDGTVTRLDAADGRVVWRWRVDSHVHATPVLDRAHGRVYVNTEQENRGHPFGHVYALDWESGRVLWGHRHACWAPATVVHCERFAAVVATANDRSIVCLDAATGAVRWSGATQGLVRGRPALAGDRVLVASEDGHLQAFDLASGELVASRRHGPGLRHQYLHADGQVAYVLDGAGHLVAFDAQTLGVRWLTRLRSPGAWSPVPFGGHLVVLSQRGHLAVLDPRREVKVWEGNVGGTVKAPPALGRAGGVPLLVVATSDAGLKAFRIHPHYDGPPS